MKPSRACDAQPPNQQERRAQKEASEKRHCRCRESWQGDRGRHVDLFNSFGATITGNMIMGNSSYGAYNASGSIITSAQDNYWRHPSGPLDDSDDRATGGLYNPTGLGDRVTDHVIYSP